MGLTTSSTRAQIYFVRSLIFAAVFVHGATAYLTIFFATHNMLMDLTAHDITLQVFANTVFDIVSIFCNIAAHFIVSNILHGHITNFAPVWFFCLCVACGLFWYQAKYQKETKPIFAENMIKRGNSMQHIFGDRDADRVGNSLRRIGWVETIAGSTERFMLFVTNRKTSTKDKCRRVASWSTEKICSCVLIDWILRNKFMRETMSIYGHLWRTSGFLRVWCMQCWFYYMSESISEVKASFTISVWHWEPGDYERMSSKMGWVHLFGLLGLPIALKKNTLRPSITT